MCYLCISKNLQTWKKNISTGTNVHAMNTMTTATTMSTIMNITMNTTTTATTMNTITNTTATNTTITTRKGSTGV